MNERQTVRCQFPSQIPCSRRRGITVVDGLVVCDQHAAAARLLRGFTPTPAPRTEDQITIEAAEQVVRTWLAALTRGDGRPVLIRREWPELARALAALSDRWPS